MSLFDPIRLRHLAFEYPRPAESTAEGLALIDRLTARQSNGTLQVLTETRVEQSFNEQLFARLFGYRTLFSHGGGDYELVPKTHTPGAKKKKATNRYDDFSLGFFGPTPRGGAALVSAELKGPGTNLDVRPSPKKASPVAQAHSGAAASARWVIVSNFDELRLYRKGDEVNFERLLLSDVVDPWDLDRAAVLFSRETLLGIDGQASPLERLVAGGPPFMIPPRTGCVRLVHEIRAVKPPASPMMLSSLDDALRSAMSQMADHWPRRSPNWSPRLRGDRLVVETESDGGVVMVLEVTRSGVMRLSEYLSEPADGVPSIKGQELAVRVGSFMSLGWRLMEHLKLAPLELRWSICEAAGAFISAPAQWIGDVLTKNPQVPTDVPSMHTPPIENRTALDARGRASLVAVVVRELLFPCEVHSALSSGDIRRLAPTVEQIEKVFADSIAMPPP